MDNAPVQVNRNIIEVMKMNRADRRRIGRRHGVRTIPSIHNVVITKQDGSCLHGMEDPTMCMECNHKKNSHA